MALYCGKDCNNFNSKDINRYGEGFCRGWGCYVKPDKLAAYCSKLCYIVSKVEEIIGNNIETADIIEANRLLILNSMSKDIDYCDFMEDYNNFGVQVADCIENDQNKEYIANYIFDNNLTSVAEKVYQDSEDEAIEIYINMFYALANYYGVEIIDVKKPITRCRKEEKKDPEYYFYR